MFIPWVRVLLVLAGSSYFEVPGGTASDSFALVVLHVSLAATKGHHLEAGGNAPGNADDEGQMPKPSLISTTSTSRKAMMLLDDGAGGNFPPMWDEGERSRVGDL